VRVLIEVSGEHPSLPRAEALATLEGERADVRSVAWTPGLVVLDATGSVERAIGRLGLAHFVSEEIARGDLDSLRTCARRMDLAGASFRVRVHGLGVDVDPRPIEEALGADFGRTGRVDLESPRIEFRVLVGEEFVLGRVIHRVERSVLEASKVARRSFSLPISLHPKFARALVNLSRAPTGATVLDPFCGTGGVLLEVSRLGMRGIGSDLELPMVRGARRALRVLKAHSEFAIADAGELPWVSGSIDAIATDPPYGRAASTKGEPPLELYDRALAAFGEVLGRGRCAALVLPTAKAIEVGETHLELLEAHPLRVHRSLTRTFCVFRRR